MADIKIMDLKENRDPDSGLTKRRPQLTVNCVNLTLFDNTTSNQTVREFSFKKRQHHYDLPSSPKLNSSLDRRYKTWYGDNLSGTKLPNPAFASTYSATNVRSRESSLPHIPTLRFFTGTPRSTIELPSYHGNGRNVNLALRSSTGENKGIYSQRQATAMDLKVMKTPLDSILCVSTWNYCMPLSARELNMDNGGGNVSPQRSPRCGAISLANA